MKKWSGSLPSAKSTRHDEIRLRSEGCASQQNHGHRPLVVSATDSVDYARDVLTKSHLGHLLVMEGDNLKGMISFHDVARACLKEANFENSLLKRYIKHWPE